MALKNEEIRGKTPEQLAKLEHELLEQLFKLRFQIASGQGENPARIRTARRELARVKTILAEQRRAQAGAAAAGAAEGNGAAKGTKE